MKQHKNLIPLLFTWLFHLLLTYSILDYYNYCIGSHSPVSLHFTIPTYNPKSFLYEKRILSEFKHKKVLSFEISGWPEEDNRIMKEIRFRAKLQEYTFDAKHIIKVHFTEEAFYGEFVAIINFLNADRHKRYIFCENDLYIVGPPDTETL